MTTDDITPGNSLEKPDEQAERLTRGMFVMPMSYAFAAALVEDLKPLALQLGSRAREFYNGLVTGLERAEAGESGMLYEHHGPSDG